MSLSSGQRLGPYEILSPLGAGGMGEVYRARDTRLGREVAVKVLPAELASDPERLRRFEQEARAAAALNHPNILILYDIGTHDGAPYIVTELLEGESLRQMLRTGPLPPARAVELGVQIAQGLAAAHGKGIVHRDLKPENLFVTEDGHVKILDFGLARLKTPESAPGVPRTEAPTLESPTREGTVLGTPGYMSPEQIRGKPSDARSDIFAFGCVLYEMLSGSTAFRGDSGPDVQAAILKEDPAPLPKGVPQSLGGVIRRCLEKRPEDRFSSAHDLRLALGALSGSQDAFASESRFEPGTLRRIKVALGVAATLFLIAAISLAVVWGLRRGMKKSAVPFEHVKISRLTREGLAGSQAAISPDGRYVAYYLCDVQGRPSLWIQQVATASVVQLVPPSPNILVGLAFSRDGNFVYYSSMPPTTNSPRLHRVPVLGGVPEPQPLYVDTSVTFSPDGKRLAFVRYVSNELWIANADGTGQKVLASGAAFLPNRPDWSPDGGTLAVAAQEGSSYSYRLQLVDVNNGNKRALGTRTWDGAGAVAWLPDGRGLLLVALDRTLAAEAQIWLVDYPSGTARPLTKDINGFLCVSVSADGKSLVSVRAETRSDIWVAPLDNLSKAVQVTRGYDSGDGFRGLCWLPDGGLVYTSKVGGVPDLWLVDKPGGQPRRLTHDPYPESSPTVSPDGRTILYAAVDHPRVGQTIYRMDADGSNPKEISPGASDGFPMVKPDGRWVLYCNWQPLRELRVPIEGGKPEPLGGEDPQKTKLFEGFIGNSLSPDGRSLAGWAVGQGGVHLSVVPLDGSGPRTVFEGALSIQGHAVWERDGKGLLYVYLGGSDIWRQGLDKAPPRKLTDLKEEAVFRLAVSPDGKQLAYSRGRYLQDVILMQQIEGD